MSYCDYDEPAAFYSDVERRARKTHRCDECNGVIQTGERYHYICGKWGGYLDTFRECMDCTALWCDVSRADGDGCGKLLGGLSEVIGNMLEDGHKQARRLHAAYEAIREARRPSPPPTPKPDTTPNRSDER